MGASQLEFSTSSRIALLRIAAAGGAGIAPSRLIADLAGLLRGAGHVEPVVLISRALAELASADLVASGARRLTLTPSGSESCRRMVGRGIGARSSWPHMRDTHLMAMALGISGKHAGGVERLGTARGLRLAVVAASFDLPARAVRSEALARMALASQVDERPAGAAGRGRQLSAAEQRELSSSLLTNSRQVGSDRQLVAALAMERSGARDMSVAALRRALLARLLPPLSPAAPPPPARPAHFTPDRAAVVASVRSVASRHARGIPGSRRLLIVEAIRHLRELHPGWQIDDQGLKAMLIDAHRQGLISLATADLRAAAELAAIRASEVRHLSSAWHYIRVEDA